MESCKNCDRVECPTLTMPPPLGADAIVVRATARNDCIAHTVNWRKEALRLREAQRWIPVTERLPPVPNRRVCICDLNAGLTFGSPDACGQWWDSVTQERLHAVTHWMPLPAPPEQTTPEVSR